MPKYPFFVFLTLSMLNLSHAEEVAETSNETELPPLNLVETPDYMETEKPNSIQVEKLQYESLEDGRPLLEPKETPQEEKEGALYHAGQELVVNPDSSLNITKEVIEDSEDEAFLPPEPQVKDEEIPSALLPTSDTGGDK